MPMAFRLPPALLQDCPCEKRGGGAGNAGACARGDTPSLRRGAERLRREGRIAAGQVLDKSSRQHMNRRSPVSNKCGTHTWIIVFWQCMSPKGNNIPAPWRRRSDKDPGQHDQYEDRIQGDHVSQSARSASAGDQLNSKLKVTNSRTAATPLTSRARATCISLNVWEHSYYLDLQSPARTLRTGSTKIPRLRLPKRNLKSA